MKSLKFLVLVVWCCLFMGIMQSCKKYDEGPAISLRSKKARVVNVWKFEKVTEDGTDVTNDYKYSTWEFKEDGKYIFSIKDPSSSLSFSMNGTWEFNNDKTKIIIIMDGEKSEAEIIKLKEKSMWLRLKETHGSTTHTIEIHLIPA